MPQAKPVILASTSPRRKELLQGAGLVFAVVPSLYEEIMPEEADPRELVREFAVKKARALAKSHNDHIIIAADTIIALGRRVFGKPADLREAENMLFMLQGRTHTVYTGFAVLDTGAGRETAEVCTASVTFTPLTRGQIRAYHKRVNPLDKAGSYAIQQAGLFTRRIVGDYNTIVGLPLCRLRLTLEKFGIPLLTEAPP